MPLKGGTQIRTGGEGFADLCLTTWLCRRLLEFLVYQTTTSLATQLRLNLAANLKNIF